MTRLQAIAIVATLLSLGLGVRAAGADETLVEAVKRAADDRPAVAALLEQGVDPNSADTYGSTALHFAVELEDLETTALLLDAGANPAATNRYDVAPLSLASANGNAAIVARLLAAGADPNTSLPGGETALMTAARTGKVDVIESLLAAGAAVDAREDARRQTALMWAAAEGHAEAIAKLIAAGADLHGQSGRAGRAPAARATTPATSEVTAVPLPDYFLRSNGGVLNTPLELDSMTPLMFAVRNGHIDAARTLIELGASPNEMASNGLSVLVLAIINAHYELASFLLDAGADPNAAGQGWTALHQVVTTPRLSYGRFPHPVGSGRATPLELAAKLIARGAKVDARMTVPTLGDGYRTRLNRQGATPLLLAAKGAYPDMLRLLLDHGADVHATTVEGTTALMLAAGVAIFNEGDDAGTEAETFAAVTLLVERGADVNAVDDNGETALHGAAYRGHNSVVQYLADQGAELDVANKIGWTPLTIADGVLYAEFFKQHRDTAALLRELHAKRGREAPDAGIVNIDINPAANRTGSPQ